MTARLSSATRAEALLALQNGIKLGASLIVTWGTALAVKLLVPRYLGPDTFGELSFADAFAGTFFVVLTLGVDMYVRKEVSVRLEHASDFFGGILLLRCALSAALVAIMAVVMHVTHRPAQVRTIVYIFAVAQLFMSINGSLTAVLHCCGRVDGVSIINVVTKIIWAGGCMFALVHRTGLWVIPASLLLSEIVRFAVVFQLAQRHAGLRLRVDRAATVAVVIAAFPFFVNMATHIVYSRLDVTLLEAFGGDREVGWYAAAQGFNSLTMLVTPVHGWVVLPILARAVARSQDEFYALVRRVLEFTLVVAIPLCLALAVGADFWVTVAFGHKFAPAALSLRILAPMSAVTYVAMTAACSMVLLNQAWRLTAISAVGLAICAVLNAGLIPLAMHLLGHDGAGGAGGAAAELGTEIFVTGAMLWHVGRNALDKRTLVRTGKLLGVSMAVIVLDRFLSPFGPRRLIADALAFVAAAVLVRAIDVRAMARFASSAIRARSAGSAAPDVAV